MATQVFLDLQVLSTDQKVYIGNKGKDRRKNKKKELLKAVKIGEVLGVAIEEENIGEIHRVIKRNERKSNPRRVLVKVNRHVKTSLFEKKKTIEK